MPNCRSFQLHILYISAILALTLSIAGMATHLSPEDQSLMLELFQAFSRLDGRGIGECTLKFNKDKQVRNLTSPTFCQYVHWNVEIRMV